ncbi:MAG: single-stranded-DNA-specific exonuclease RecJ [Bacteroidetes bacterium GWF2_33_16]|nr:MAG: single-stranded-DNA-specific exonuclease RecJ [Bacteroidetes bacterium GWE2_32_14]OFY05195.1 MAG: single-stranded-DNA-specific exonuclease RecJ [Bacteroidetes bacterium GWF2_33_16]
MEKRWVLKQKGRKDDVENLAQELNIEPVLANLLLQRGVKTFEDARRFFRPELSDLYDPFLMKDMDLAVERIEKAVKNNENILIYGDYDVDGTTSVALMYSFLKKFHPNIDFYVPDRYSEGYGISIQGINYAIEKNVKLIIALDCGIKANEKVAYAKENGIDFIICDHHYPGSELPDAVAVLDAKRPDCNYPFKELSGCGVGFKLIQAYSITNNIPFGELIEYLDLVVVSIASDIVPIVDENRILAHFGLIQINKAPREGLKSIIQISGLSGKKIAVEDIVFKLGPRINAAGRMESAHKAVELLLAANAANAKTSANSVDDFNDARKNIDRSITQDALRMLFDKSKLEEKKSTVLYNSKWHKGVVGIVASRLIETYYRPTVILTASNGMATGSARSVMGYDIYQAIEKCADLLENFGGHMYAAGLTMKIDNVSKFIDRFERIVSETILDEQLVPQIEIDAELKLSEITPKFFRILKQFQPFGPENMAPVFLAENVSDNGEGRIVGPSKEHLKLALIHEEEPFKGFPAIAFQQANNFDYIRSGDSFDICYTIDENNFRDKSTIQLNIKDIKINKRD